MVTSLFFIPLLQVYRPQVPWPYDDSPLYSIYPLHQEIPAHQDKCTTLPDPSSATARRIDKLRPHQGARRAKRKESKNGQEQTRRLQLDGDDKGVDVNENYFIIIGGDAFVKYSCSGMSATWDRQYFYFTGPNGIEDGAYVEDGGG